MSANVNHVEDPTIAPVQSVTQSANSLKAQEVKLVASKGGSAGGNVDSKTSISSMDDLKKKAPQVYNAMVQGIAMDICNQMQHAQDRLKSMMRKSEQGQ